MKRFKIKMNLSIGPTETVHGSGTLEVPDDATFEQIEEMVEDGARQWAGKMIDLCYAYEPENEHQ